MAYDNRSLSKELQDLLKKASKGPWESIDKTMGGHHFQFIKGAEIIENNRGPDYNREIFGDENYPTKAADQELAVWIRNNGHAVVACLQTLERQN